MTEMARPSVGVAVIVETPWGYPMLKRKSAHANGQWCWPGGHLEGGETVLECAIRETQEEIGVCLTSVKVLPWFTEDFFPDENKHYITLYVWGKTDGEPTICEPDKCDEMTQVRDQEKQLPIRVWPKMTGVEESWRKFQKMREGE